MATTIKGRTSPRLVSTTRPSWEAMSGATPGGSSVAAQVNILRNADLKELAFSLIAAPNYPTFMGWRSERLAADATIAGQITFQGYAQVISATGASGSGTLRVQLWKRTQGGSDVDRLIAQVDAGTTLTTALATYTLTYTPPIPIPVAVGERFYLRWFVVRASASFDTMTYSIRHDASNSFLTQQMTVTFTENLTFQTDVVRLYPRRTNTIGIGNFFDLLPTFGASATTTAVVATTAGSAEKQWTRISGGTVLEFISPRFAGEWMPAGTEQVPGTAWTGGTVFSVIESSLSANCGMRFKMFRRKPDGTETQFYVYSDSTEFGTAAASESLGPGTLSPTNVGFSEDDRLVARFYIIPVGGTMGGGFTCTMEYDGNVVGTGNTYFELMDMAAFKAESDPDRLPIPSGLSMTGLGNGQ